MKKVYLLLSYIIFALWTSNSFANRDSVNSVSYGATTHNPLNVTLKFDNLLTNDKSPDYTIDGNLFSISNFSVENGGCVIYREEHKLKITYNYTKSTYKPENDHTCTLSVYIDKNDLKDYVNSNLRTPSNEEKEKIKNSITYGLDAKIKIVLKLTTDSNGGSLSDYTAGLPSYTLSYNYLFNNETGGGETGGGETGGGETGGGETGGGETGGGETARASCGESNGKTFNSKPSNGLCSSGELNWRDEQALDGVWNWACGEVSCMAAKNNIDDCNASLGKNTASCNNEINIKNEHIMPTISSIVESLNNEDEVAINSENVRSLSDNKITILADIKKIVGEKSSYYPLGKIKVTHNGTDGVGVEKIIATVMDQNGNAPLSNDCIYRGNYTSGKKEGTYIYLYINGNCLDIHQVGNYKISYQYVDEAGYSSNEYHIPLKVIPGQVDTEKSNISFIANNTEVYADADSLYKVSFQAKDKYNNIIKNRDVIASINTRNSTLRLNYVDNNSEASLYPPTIKSEKFDSNGKFEYDLYSYNTTGNYNINIDYTFNKVKPSIYGGYIKRYSYITFRKSFTKDSINFKEIVDNYKIRTGDNSYILGIGMDVPIKLSFDVKNYNNPNSLEDVNIKWTPVMKDATNNTIIKGMEVVAATGYEEILSKLKSGNYSIDSLSKNSTKEIDLVIRIESNGDDIAPKVKLSGTGYISYQLDGEGGKKTVKNTINWDSNLVFKYWGIYVEGIFSNNSKGLYEILRKIDSKMSNVSSLTLNKLKTNTYNSILRNVNKVVRGHSLLGSDNIISDIAGVYYNKGENIVLKLGKINENSLVYVEGANVVIEGNILKNGGLLTIVVKSDSNGKGGYIEIDPEVTNIDAILVSEKGIFPTIAMKNGELDNGKIWEIIKGNKNSDLNNQLLINGLVVSRGNTVGGSIKFKGKYVLPGGKEIEGTRRNYYDAARYDLNYLRRYHKEFNAGNPAQGLDETKYGTYPVVIRYDSSIKVKKPYGF